MNENIINKIDIILDDITKLDCDCIVNAANKRLLGGGGVDGAIHRAAGKKLLEECRKIGGCDTGEAVITNAYNLKAKKIIHTVGPVWYGGKNNEHKLLKSCYLNSLKLADKHNIKSIAFPCISTGVYRFPKEEAVNIAFETVYDHLNKPNTNIKKIIFVCFENNDYKLYIKKLNTYK
jgi:O-acetyl-ADP-ribose deacetylase (regulator of RNase III)